MSFQPTGSLGPLNGYPFLVNLVTLEFSFNWIIENGEWISIIWTLVSPSDHVTATLC